MKLPDLEGLLRGLRTIVPDRSAIVSGLRSLQLALPWLSSRAGLRRGPTTQDPARDVGGSRRGRSPAQGTERGEGSPRGGSTTRGSSRAATRGQLPALMSKVPSLPAIAGQIRKLLARLPGHEAMGRSARRLVRRLPGPAGVARSLRALVVGASEYLEAASRGWLGALVLGRCPRCHSGDVFRGLVSMNERCPRCELKFEREPGYFVAAMYLSYGAAVVVISAFYWSISWLLPQASFEASLAAATLLFMPLVPAVFQYSRILWIYIDRTIDAPRNTEAPEEPR